MIKEDKLKSFDERCKYIDTLFDYMYPDEEPYYYSWYVAFPQRYNNEEIKFPKLYNGYIKDKDLQERINAFGLDVEKFWYFILFLYDISDIKSKGFVPKKESAKTQFRNFLNTIDSAINLNENGVPILDERKQVTFKKDVQIEIKIDGRKQNNISINNTKAVFWLSIIMEEFFDRYKNYEEVKKFISDIDPDEDLDYKTKIEDYWNDPNNENKISDYCFIKTGVKDGDDLYLLKSTEKFDASINYRNYLIIHYLKNFFKLNSNIIKKGKDINLNNLYNKDYFIGVILCFMDNIFEKQDKIEYVKKTYKYYKEFDIKGFSLTGDLTYKQILI